MNKDSIADLLEEKNQSLLTFLKQQPDENWQLGPIGKWTSGQQALHLLQSIKPLNDALSMPKFILRYKFGKSNSKIRNYDAIVKHYQDLLKDSNGFTFKGSQTMKIPNLKDKSYILNRLQVENKKLQYKTLKMSDAQLDTLMLPHPLLGKLPVREILMWTAHHIEHHTKRLQDNY